MEDVSVARAEDLLSKSAGPGGTEDEESTALTNDSPMRKRFEMMEQKDTLYDVLAPQHLSQQNADEDTFDDDEVGAAPHKSSNSRSARERRNRSALLESTLKKSQQAWVDPWECAVQDTFYHRQIDNLRPTFEVTAKIFSDKARRQTADLREEDEPEDDIDHELEETEAAALAEQKEASKFGPWDGVMAGCLLNIFGVIMFLRVGFVVGQAGIIGALAIMSISAVVVILTALSMSAICTNGTILAGGAYYIISRALGPSIGGAIGLLFSLGNMFACSLYLIGFAETLVANLADFGFQIFDDPVMDVRIWSNVVLCFVLLLAIVGLKYVIKANLGLLVFIVCAILLFFTGSFYKEVDNDEGVMVISPSNWSNGNFTENLGSGYQDGFDFWGTLAIFFPAVTGIMAGANISGDLRNPSSDIPKGTLSAIGISTVVYMIMAVVVGAVTVRSELIGNELVMSLICVWEYIVLIGIYAATLSSAIASLVGAPRILQAVANDEIFPWKWLKFFAKADKNGNPIRGYFLTFGVAFCCNLIGELNAIAPLISQFFMITYLLINCSCFALEVSRSPGWRPSFKYFNKYSAGFGAFLCLTIMFLLDWTMALGANAIALSLFCYIQWKDPEVNWGAAPQARKYYAAMQSILKLRKTKAVHTKNWRPGLLVLVRDPIKRAQMMLFAQTLKKAHGPIFYGTVHTGDYRTNIRKFRDAHSLGYLPTNAPKNSKGFYEAVLAETFRSGVQNLFQLVGMGSLRPNTLVIGFKRNWQKDEDSVLNEYVQILRDTLVMGMGLMIIVGTKRINWFLEEYAPPPLQHDLDDYTEDVKEVTKDMFDAETITDKETDGDDIQNEIAQAVTMGVSGAGSPRGKKGYEQLGAKDKTSKMRRMSSPRGRMKMPRNPEQEERAIYASQAWQAGQGKDTVIDVWWMIDDGGLCMLIPHIMKLHKFWRRCKLRMLMVAEEDDVMASNVSSMKALLHQFRLPYEGPFLVRATKTPRAETTKRFEELAQCKLEETPRPKVIAKWLILSDLLFAYSRFSGLNVVTLPIPTKHMQPRMYVALLQMLSDQTRLPPTMIMRGNGESTLTFYSE